MSSSQLDLHAFSLPSHMLGTKVMNLALGIALLSCQRNVQESAWKCRIQGGRGEFWRLKSKTDCIQISILSHMSSFKMERSLNFQRPPVSHVFSSRSSILKYGLCSLQWLQTHSVAKAGLEFLLLLLHLLKGASTPGSELLCLDIHEGYNINVPCSCEESCSAVHSTPQVVQT